MEGLRTVLQLTLRARTAVRLCTGAVYSSDSSSANSSGRLNRQRIQEAVFGTDERTTKFGHRWFHVAHVHDHTLLPITLGRC